MRSSVSQPAVRPSALTSLVPGAGSVPSDETTAVHPDPASARWAALWSTEATRVYGPDARALAAAEGLGSVDAAPGADAALDADALFVDTDAPAGDGDPTSPDTGPALLDDGATIVNVTMPARARDAARTDEDGAAADDELLFSSEEPARCASDDVQTACLLPPPGVRRGTSEEADGFDDGLSRSLPPPPAALAARTDEGESVDVFTSAPGGDRTCVADQTLLAEASSAGDQAPFPAHAIETALLSRRAKATFAQPSSWWRRLLALLR